MFGSSKGFHSSKPFGGTAAPPRSGASSVNVSGATSMGDFGGKSNVSSGVSSPSIDVLGDSNSNPLPPMDSLPTTGGDTFKQPPIPLAPKSNPFTAGGSSSSAFGSSFGASNKIPQPKASSSSFGAAFSTPTSSRTKSAVDSPDISPVSNPTPGSQSPAFTSPANKPFAATSNNKDTSRNLFTKAPPSTPAATAASSSSSTALSPAAQTSSVIAFTSSNKNPRQHPLEKLDGWSEERIQSMRAASGCNKSKMAQLDAIGYVQHAADSLVLHDAGLATQRAIIEGWMGKMSNLKTLLDKSEIELNKLIAENPVLAKSSGAAFSESVDLQDLWLDKQDEFVDCFVSYRDRYLTVHRGTKLVKIGKAVSAATAKSQRETWDRTQATYGAPGVLGQYLRLEE